MLNSDRFNTILLLLLLTLYLLCYISFSDIFSFDFFDQWLCFLRIFFLNSRNSRKFINFDKIQNLIFINL